MYDQKNDETLTSLQRRLAQLERARDTAARRHRALRRCLTVVALGAAVAAPGVAAAVEVPHTFGAGESIIAEHFNENFGVLAEAIAMRTVSEDTTLDVAAADGCDGITQALATLDGVSIASGAAVTITVAEGTYFCDAPLEMTHPDGASIRIVGAGLPANTVLSFPGYGVRARFGRSLGRLANLTLRGNDIEVGVDVRAASSVTLDNVIVERFEVGVQVREGAAVVGGNVVAQENTAHGFVSFRAGSLQISDAISESNGGNGFWSFENGSMSLPNASRAAFNSAEGYLASNGATIVATSPEANENTQNGFISSTNSTLVVSDPASTNNSGYGFAAIRGGFLRRNGVSTSSGNESGPVNEPLNTPNISHGAVINE